LFSNNLIQPVCKIILISLKEVFILVHKLLTNVHTRQFFSLSMIIFVFYEIVLYKLPAVVNLYPVQWNIYISDYNHFSVPWQIYFGTCFLLCVFFFFWTDISFSWFHYEFEPNALRLLMTKEIDAYRWK
jgi:hypothetical protein